MSAGQFATDFDGSSDYYNLGGNLTGISDSKVGTASFWYDTDTFGDALYVFHSGKLFAFRNTTNTIYMRGYNAAAAKILDLRTKTTITASGWHSCLMSYDLATGTGHVYQDDVEDKNAGATLTNDLVAHSASVDWGIGATSGGSAPFNGSIAEVYFALEYLDLSVEANRRKFISASGKPVPLGPDGGAPTGTAAIIYAPDGNPVVNQGSGGNFTEVSAPVRVVGPGRKPSYAAKLIAAGA